MIKFRQKEFSEYDAMRSLYVELMKRFEGGDNRNRRQRISIIDSSALLPILKGNNVVIEKFTISTSFFGKDKYRMYLKIGAKAKLPDEVRLPGTYKNEKLGNVSVKFNGAIFPKNFSNGPRPFASTEVTPYFSVERTVKKLLGEAIKYDKKERSLVLEFGSIDDAVQALNILPFGIDYRLYLLNA